MKTPTYVVQGLSYTNVVVYVFFPNNRTTQLVGTPQEATKFTSRILANGFALRAEQLNKLYKFSVVSL